MAAVEEAVRMVPVGKVKLAEDNLRTNLGDLKELAASIESSGVVQPLLVRKGDLMVVAGARRLEAAKRAGLKEVPIIERPFTEQERLEVMIIENLQREDLDPIEEATGYSRLQELGLTQTQVAQRVGRAQSHIARRLSLLALPEPVQNHVAGGAMKIETAQELAKLKDDPDTLAKIAKSAVKAIEKASKGGKQDKQHAADQADRTVTGKVRTEVANRERRKKMDAALRQLKKAKEPVVELTSDEWGYNVRPPEGMALVKPQTMNADDVEFDPEKHAKLDCHRVGVHPITMNLIEVCAEPETHPNKAEQAKKERDKREAEREAENQRRVELAERRQRFVTEAAQSFTGRKTSKGQADKEVLLHLCFLSYVEEPGYGRHSASEIGWGLLGIEEEQEVDKLLAESKQAADVSLEDVDYEELLLAFARRSISNRYRATFVLAAAMFECSPYSVPSSYLELLVSLGYEPSPNEVAQLKGGDQPSEDEDDS